MSLPEIFEAGPEAADLYAALHAQCFPDPWSEADFARLLASSGVQGLIARAQDDPQGLSLIRSVAGECELLTIGVLPAARRTGVGAFLLAQSEIAARRAGSKRLFLEVSERNAPAGGLYEREGYRQIGLRKGYYRDGAAARVLARDLV
ncbi:ribosomal-protein-alanine acetyltransferase, putative [Oceanicaulis sp. HTCC2633]|uniref:GNAT family N-acetyltransferase n=1 Tax=Oceanicaulis sp. HTCC2633 TaxID=314254 RepID=UPI000066975C|nr:GNAT family N-acetyltransferase [Oceanicaulis sp. HTCC2633]EAP89630.1 ribosomal-protein-alanine acetyltransferase, putative [Oceanicaulis sp. HTCC2633]